jgi:hypothetical protein
MINEIGIAFVAASPVLGFFIGDGISAKAYEKAFSEGEKYGSDLAMVACNITIKSLRRQNKNLYDSLCDSQSKLNELRLINESNKILRNESLSLRNDISRLSNKLSDARMKLRKHAEAHPTAEAYMACMNWGSWR